MSVEEGVIGYTLTLATVALMTASSIFSRFADERRSSRDLKLAFTHLNIDAWMEM